MMHPILYSNPKNDIVINLFNAHHADAIKSWLRPLCINDVNKEYMDGLNNSVIRRWLSFSHEEKASLESIKSYVQSNLDDPNSVLLGFFIDEKLCGTVRLHRIASSEPQIGIAIFDLSIWGKSWATVILKSVCRFAFQELGLLEIFAGIDVKNIGSIRAFRKAGFQQVDDREINYELGTAIMMVCKSDSNSNSETH